MIASVGLEIDLLAVNPNGVRTPSLLARLGAKILNVKLLLFE